MWQFAVREQDALRPDQPTNSDSGWRDRVCVNGACVGKGAVRCPDLGALRCFLFAGRQYQTEAGSQGRSSECSHPTPAAPQLVCSMSTSCATITICCMFTVCSRQDDPGLSTLGQLLHLLRTEGIGECSPRCAFALHVIRLTRS